MGCRCRSCRETNGIEARAYGSEEMPDFIRIESLDDPRVAQYALIGDQAQLLEHKCVPFADKLLYSDLLGIEKP